MEKVFQDITDFERKKQDFKKIGYIKFTSFFMKETFSSLLKESNTLLESHAKRKDFQMEETNNSPRKISTVSGHVIQEESKFITELYNNESLIEFLEELSGVKLYITPDISDRHAIHKLHKKNDVHGGHIDTYPFVLITCLEAPTEDGGGELEFVPYSTNLDDLGTKKSIIDAIKTGDSYFMHAGMSVHRVLPLRENTNRTVLVFTYADEISKDIKLSYSTDQLYN
ncbi:hypothetical protein KORDIASMS9_02940 [Kordia sp. SMS9]|uniref:HalD/BesD family halogenase n=1 Tax=Kordia sp. SMS9 TaxID=2282170 RepID=UPI000E0D639A|nr:hypothetical protein [Kordia sp. SMS9]AXG70694.1 hypothetical protein KORDIASMS9_02940 [Kordia sp. SMS9]